MREHREAVGFSLSSPADLYGLTCKHHDHELDAVEGERLGGGDKPPDDQGVHQVGAVSEPPEGMKTFQLSRALMGPGTRCHVLCSRCGSVDRWNRTTAHSLSEQFAPGLANQINEKDFQICCNRKLRRKRKVDFEIMKIGKMIFLLAQERETMLEILGGFSGSMTG